MHFFKDISVLPKFIRKLPYPYSDCFDTSFLDQEQSINSDKQKIRENFIQNLNRTNRNLIAETIRLTNTYTQQYCLQLCYQEFLIRYCKCYDHTLSNFKPENLRSCPKFIDSLYNCQYIIKRIFYNGLNDEKCLKRCPIQCDFSTYHLTVSKSAYPSKAYFEMLKGFRNRDFLRNLTTNFDYLEPSSLLSVNIFYQSNTFTSITEKPSSN